MNIHRKFLILKNLKNISNFKFLRENYKEKKFFNFKTILRILVIKFL